MAKKSNKNQLKYWLGKIHLWGGLVSGIVVFIVSVTGCLYVFEEEIRNLTQKEFRFVSPENSPKASLTTISDNLKAEFPDKKIEQIRIYADPSRTVMAKMVNAREAYKKDEDKIEKQAYVVHPYSGKVMARKNLEHDFMHYVEKMHKSLLLGETGKWIIKVNIVVFLVMLLSGLYLWWPGKKNQRKAAFNLKLTGKFQLINYSFHNTLGFYFLLPLMIITLTGIWWAIKPTQKWTYAALGDQMKKEKKLTSTPVEGKSFTPDMAFAQVTGQYPGWNEAHVNFAKNAKEPVKINLKYPYEVYKKHNVFEFDQYSGKLLSAELYANYSTPDKIKHANRDLHTGQNYGIIGKLIAFFASLFSATLPVTGFLIWYQRKYKTKPVKQRIPQPASVQPVAAPRRVPVRRQPVGAKI